MELSLPGTEKFLKELRSLTLISDGTIIFTRIANNFEFQKLRKFELIENYNIYL